MQSNCTGFGCTNNERKKINKTDNVTYHRFPKGKEFHKKWIHARRKKDSFNADVSQV